MDRLALKVPVFGELIRKATVARWTRTCSTMFAAGVPLVEALDSVGGASGNWVYLNATRQIQQEVSTGTGSIEFLRWVLEELKIFIDRRKTMAAHGRPSVLAITWADDKRRRAYAWLKRLGFEEGVDSDGDPAYVMHFPPPQPTTTDPEHS